MKHQGHKAHQATPHSGSWCPWRPSCFRILSVPHRKGASPLPPLISPLLSRRDTLHNNSPLGWCSAIATSLFQPKQPPAKVMHNVHNLHTG
jgi:hypothetical protein